MTDHDQKPNALLSLLLERASCRDFTGERIPSETLQCILEAGVHSPTAGNLQPYSIIKIEKQQSKRRLKALCGGQEFVAKAAVDLLFCIDWHRLQRWAESEIAPFTATSSFRCFWLALQDTMICAQSVCTAAEAAGLGACYTGTILEHFRELREVLRMPEGVFPVVLLCLGHPVEPPKPARKLDADVIVHDETYRELDDQALTDAFDIKYFGRQREITPERLEKLEKVCRNVHGQEFARQCLDRIHANGWISAAQTYFGLLYAADEMPLGNEDFLKVMEEAGFCWFKKFRPVKPSSPRRK